LTLKNTSVNDNVVEQVGITVGGIFVLIINAQGLRAGIITSTLNASDCKFFNNNQNGRYGKAIYLEGAIGNVERCSFYNNIGNMPDVYAFTGSVLNLNNSTVNGLVGIAIYATANLKNSTIIGGGVAWGDGQHITLDNTIWTDMTLAQFPSTSVVSVKYSILNNYLYGFNKDSVISNSIPNFTTWLDTLAYNGGITPTAKLKNVPANPAKSSGNSEYLGSTDQRGAMRVDSVSIGAYQWVRPTGISISPQQITLCPGDSTGLVVTILPALVSEGGYTLTSLYDTVAQVIGSKIHAISPGTNDIIVQTMDGGLKDTCSVAVVGPCQALVTNQTVLPGQNKCYSATQTIVVAGNSATFTVLNGGSATLIAGQKISFLPGTTVESGGYLWGYISPDGPFCQASQPGKAITEANTGMTGIGLTSFRVYPNPTAGQFVIAFAKKTLSENVTVEIYGMYGEKVLSKIISAEQENVFSLSNQPAGVYFIRVMMGTEYETAKIIRQ
jgi:hypothetical protein